MQSYFHSYVIQRERPTRNYTKYSSSMRFANRRDDVLFGMPDRVISILFLVRNFHSFTSEMERTLGLCPKRSYCVDLKNNNK